jgi:hypothetical protein
MIVNLPNSEEFERLAKNCLVQAFDIVFDTDKAIFEIGEKALQEDVWKYSQGKLNTAVVLVHQAIECFMKASVCKTSPLLLLEGKRKDWPVLPQQGDKDFNEFYTTPAEALIRTYAATAQHSLGQSIIDHIEIIRTLRNQIVHGISRIELNTKRLIESILDTFMFFLGQDVWWDELLAEHINHPLVDYYGFGAELSRYAERLDYVEAIVGKARFAKLFTMNTKARRYMCPFCSQLWDDELGADIYPYRWAFLKGKDIESQTVYCLSCNVESPVVRKDCYYTDCKGSVRHYGDSPEDIICLTCGQQQFAGTQADDDAEVEVKRRAEEERLQLLYPGLYIGAVESASEDKPKRRSRKKAKE